jgi:3-isopropylmalate/(R)-2-methylmalate dehydratase large subunit
MVLCNMAIEMGAKAGVCFPDDKVYRFLSDRTDMAYEPVYSDPGAAIEKEIQYDVSKLGPQVSCPHMVDNVKAVEEVMGTPIDQAVIGSCTNGRLEDLMAAASILSGRQVADSVRLIIVPASREVYIDAADRGLMSCFAKAGAIVVNPGCGPCLGAHQGLLAPGEKCISTTNRNFKGRMGSPEAEVYLASPLTVAASAVLGEIADPRRLLA